MIKNNSKRRREARAAARAAGPSGTASPSGNRWQRRHGATADDAIFASEERRARDLDDGIIWPDDH